MFYASLLAHFETLEQQLNQLDAATGDGDHGTTMVKGLRAIVAADSSQPVKAFRRAAGGASGSLFAQLISAFEKVMHDNQGLAESLETAAERISQIGQAEAGDKTMLDALIPATQASNLEDILMAAQQGADSTIPMIAKRGRARYVEGGGAGHKDAGATSVAEMLSVFVKHIALLDPEKTEGKTN